MMQARFFELIERENNKGATVFFSSHILREVQRLCHRVAFIKEGTIIRLEKVNTLQDYKRIKVEAKNAVSDEYFRIDGVKDLQVENNTATFIFQGDVNPVMRKIADLDLANVSVVEPDLEEIFLHYYAKEGG